MDKEWKINLQFYCINFTILGIENPSFNLTACVLLGSIIFDMSDIINDYYGRRGVRSLSFIVVLSDEQILNLLIS
ncbi:MAG TPA: hypothetical protein PL018_06540 [Ignavibacteriaceae bacterium]|nr:hypothetical protein [Ignavibacteriaceae bacterium]